MKPTKTILFTLFLTISACASAQTTVEELDQQIAAERARIDSIYNQLAIDDSIRVAKTIGERVAHYISPYLGFGMHSLSYEPKDGKLTPYYGGSFKLAYELQLNRHWIFSFGAQVTSYMAMAEYNYTYAKYNQIHPDNGLLYDQKSTFSDWKERQLLLQVEVPIIFNYRHFFTKKWGFVFGVGCSFGFPVYNDYKTLSGTYAISGYFPSTNVEYFDIKEHGFVTNDDRESGDVKYNSWNIGALADLGFTYTINDASDFYIGLYGGYYFLNAIKSNPQELYTDKYNSTFASDRVSDVKPYNLGLKIGFRFRTDNGKRRAAELKKILDDGRNAKREVDLMKLQLYRDSILAAQLASEAAERARLAAENDEAARQRIADEEAANAALAAEFKALRAEHDSLIKKKQELEARKRIAEHINSIAHFDSAQDFPLMDDDAREALNKLVDLMNTHPDVYVMIYGHADASGNSDQNIIYGQRRAEALKTILVQNGADPSRIICVSRGDKDPVATNETPEGRKLNRRAEIDIREK